MPMQKCACGSTHFLVTETLTSRGELLPNGVLACTLENNETENVQCKQCSKVYDPADFSLEFID